MNPENRAMLQVSLDDAIEADQVLKCLWETLLRIVDSLLKITQSMPT